MSTLAWTPPGFDVGLANELANLVLAAYDQFRPPVGRPPHWPLVRPFEVLTTFSARLPFRQTESFGFVARHQETGIVYVAFRGTESVDDWLMNVELRLVPQSAGWGRVDGGFSGVYAQCSTGILDAVRLAGARQVIVTGHSLGGALATLCVADVRASLDITPTLYTFASPRTGDPAFAARFNSECPVAWRVVNTEDVITTVPPSTSALERKYPRLLADILHLLSRLPLIRTWVTHRMGWTRLWHSGQLYEHVGTPVDFTKNGGTVLANHDLLTYLGALAPVPPDAGNR